MKLLAKFNLILHHVSLLPKSFFNSCLTLRQTVAPHGSKGRCRINFAGWLRP